jgi:hypothetical protein
MTALMKRPMKRPPEQLVKPRQNPTRAGRAPFVAMLVAFALAALRCSVDVPLGVDPRSDAADDNVDAGAGN